jgi:hypothetical protein
VPKECISQRKVLPVKAEEQRQVNAVHSTALLLLLQLQEQPKVPQAIACHCCYCRGEAAHAAW